ncbi:NUDIX domain-containing protein [Arthrobacter sp. YA7-1]|uniref:NUDIX domain-containing protein n=1 Tax=Arthrobacter sp. YA7-1 TaxID=2987701 RepID=UPI0029CAC3D5|nr:NUDIX domain-containing protein [Arthrobacter sp. YA7-1]
MHDKRGIDAAIHDLSVAHMAEEGLLNWFQSEWLMDPRPLAADVWVFSPDFQRILVVQHRWRGLVPPGGRVEQGETPREGAIRELAEETGAKFLISDRPAFAAARSYRSDWTATLNLSYWTIADPTTELLPEVGQPARWVDVRSDWRTFHKPDATVIARFAEQQSAY